MAGNIRRRTDDPAKKTIRRRKVYQKRRDALIEKLGSKCVECGEETAEKLTFDHIHGRDWDIRKVHGTKRLRIYAEEAEAGKIQLLCLSCNSAKGKPEPQEPDAAADAYTPNTYDDTYEEIPF